MRILDKIQSPIDLKKIPLSDLPRLAQEIREEIVGVVSQTGTGKAISIERLQIKESGG